MDGALMPIGLFSRATLISVKALRAYHEAGILVPARVDPRTGYRAYTTGQLADAAILRRLRLLDLPLERVKEVLSARDPEVTRRVLAAHHQAMQARLADTERIVAELQSGLELPTTHTPVHVREEAAAHTARVRGRAAEADFGEWLGWAYGLIGAVLAAAGVAPSGPAGALYMPEIQEDGVEEVEAFIPIAAPFGIPASERDVAIGELAATRAAVLTHAGSYETIDVTYRTLGAWVATFARPSGERVREWYVLGPPDAADPARYRTEIAWPLET